MDIFKVVAFGIISTVLVVLLKEQRKDIALILTIFSSLAIVIFAIDKIGNVISLLDNLANNSGINKEYLVIILKVTGIAYIVEFGKNICLDAGLASIATKLEMAGKVAIVTLSIPIITSLFTVLVGLV